MKGRDPEKRGVSSDPALINSEGGDNKMNEEKLIRRDRMRFAKNSLAANLVLLAILFDVLYFVGIYQREAGTYYHTYMIGISVIYNLIFMLAAFLSSEGVKNYKKNYTFPLLILGALQIVRIFILPMDAHAATYTPPGTKEVLPVMSDGQFVAEITFLVISAVCLVAGAIANYVRCTALEAHMKMLEEQSAQGGGSAQQSV